MAVLAACVLIPWSTLASAGIGEVGARPIQGFSAGFVLEVISPAERTRSAGRVEVIDGQQIFLEVTAPLQQRIWLNGTHLTLHWPESMRVAVAEYDAAAAPMAFDVIVMALSSPVSTLGTGAELLESTVLEGRVRRRYELKDSRGRKAGELHVEEGPGGVQGLAVLDEDGVLRRRYRFGERVLVGGHRVPVSMDGEYYSDQGLPLRAERWTLSEVGVLPLDGSARAGRAPDLPPGVVPETLTW